MCNPSNNKSSDHWCISRSFLFYSRYIRSFISFLERKFTFYIYTIYFDLSG